MPKKIYVVKLTDEQRPELEGVVRKGKVAGWKIQRAQELLKCDQGAPWPLDRGDIAASRHWAAMIRTQRIEADGL